MSPLKGEFDNAVELPQGKLFWCVKQRRRSLSSCISVFFPSCSLILQWIFKYYCDLFIAAQCSASLSYFQVDIFTGGREGRHIDLYMGGVTLDFVTALGGVPGRASFCCCLKGSVTFSGSSPRGLKVGRAGLVSSTSPYNLPRFCLKGRREKEGSFTSWGQLPVARWLHADISSYCVLSLDAANMKTMKTWRDLPSHCAAS